MQISDTIADMLTRIRNASAAKHDSVDVPASNVKKAIAQILLDEGYITSFQVEEDGKQGVIHITLKYGQNKAQVINGIRRISKPGLRIYTNVEEMPKVMKGLGIAILSTSKGIMTDKQARKANVGGEVLAYVWYGGALGMSRIGKKPITIPAGVDVKVDGSKVTVKGPKGTLENTFNSEINIALEGNEIIVTRPTDDKNHRALHGLTRTLIHNMVEGVTNGYSKTLEVNGVGYRAQKQGKNLVLNLGYSHQVIVPEVPGITIEVPSANSVVISGADKQQVGQFAAEVREKRPPEPYKGKGIKYADEHIRRKEGKAGKGAKK